MDPWTAFTADAKAVLKAALAAIAPDAPLPLLEEPPDPAMGDLGMPCFSLAKNLSKAPAAIAEDVAGAASTSGWVVEIVAVGPYVNVRMDRARLVGEILADPGVATKASPKPGKILIEHTSANPNGPLHVGRARNPILGDTLVRIHRAAGYDVEAQYYMDDLGRQVAMLYWGKQHVSPEDLPPTRLDKPDHDLVRYYQAAEEARQADPAVADEIAALVARLEEAPKDLLPEVEAVYMECFAGMQTSLERLGVQFDSIKHESDLVRSGDVESVIAGLRASPRARQEADGANFLDLSAELEGNKSTKFFFTRRDGTSVYATRDVAYHAWKADRVGSDGNLVNILGEDHRLQSLQVGIALGELGKRRPTVAFYAFVSLPEGKMSTRANRVVFVDDLLEEAEARAYKAVKTRRGDELNEDEMRTISEAVGVAAIRYNLASVQPEKPIKFRWEAALDFDGDSAPYIMYAYARAASLLAKAEAAGLVVGSADPNAAGSGEEALAAQLARTPVVLEEAARNLAPHRVCHHALAVAGAFNAYYRDHPVLDCPDAATQAMRLQMVSAAAQTLAHILTALGLPVLSSM